jgi:hypothetical protein
VDEVASVPAAKPSRDEDKKKEAAQFKLSPALQQVLNCMRIASVSSRAPGQGTGCATDKDGKIRVQLQLLDKSAETMKKLQALGFEIVTDPRSSATVAIGRIAALKLDELANLAAVRYVSSLDAPTSAPAVSKGGKR